MKSYFVISKFYHRYRCLWPVVRYLWGHFLEKLIFFWYLNHSSYIQPSKFIQNKFNILVYSSHKWCLIFT